MVKPDQAGRQKEDIRRQMLNAALTLLVNKGFDETNIRNIAALTGFSVGSVYLHFQDKNEILHALHQHGFVELSSRFRVLDSVSDPMERLKAMGREYLRFAMANPRMYELMFQLSEPLQFLASVRNGQWNEGAATFGILKQTVADCLAAGHFKDHHADPLAFLFWSCVHGMCALRSSQRAKGAGFEQDDAIEERSYEELLKMLDRP